MTRITVNILVEFYSSSGVDAVESYRDLIAWKKAKDLALEVYCCTREFPKAEIYGLSAQMRRAAVSVPSNIAEGKGRYSQREFVQFLHHARGSLLELETQLEIARDLGYFDSCTFKRITGKSTEVGRILNGLIRRFQVQPTRLS